MATKHSTDHRKQWTAEVAVRIPRDGGADLESDARRRLQRVQSVERVEIRELRGIEPALAATIAQFEIAVETATALDEHRLRQVLSSASGTERVDGVEPNR